MGKLDKAKEYLKRGLDLDHKNMMILNALIETYFMEEDVGNIEEFSRRALEIEPENARNLLFLGSAILFKGRASEAIELFRKAETLGAPEDQIARIMG